MGKGFCVGGRGGVNVEERRIKLMRSVLMGRGFLYVCAGGESWVFGDDEGEDGMESLRGSEDVVVV